MRAMILAAGLGTRMRPLTDFCAKPALPVRGRPVISLLLEVLAKNDIREVMINLHYLPQTIHAAIESDRPASMEIAWSDEPEPLGTGGGIRRAASFLSGTDECVVLSGDMLVDIDLASLVQGHRSSDHDATLVLLNDVRAKDFGTIGVDSGGRVTRLGQRTLRLNDPNTKPEVEVRAGLFTGVRIFSKRIFESWPKENVFEDLRDWLAPGIEHGSYRVAGAFADPDRSVWEPVGTLNEYLRMNLSPPYMPSLGGGPENWTGDVEVAGDAADVILGSQSQIGRNARLERAVVWAGESVPERFVAHDGVFAAGRFHDCGPETAILGQQH